MDTDIKYTLNVQNVDNPLTPELGDTSFVLVPNGTANFDRVLSEVMLMNAGLRRETIEMSLKLWQQAVIKLTLSGMRVNTGLYSAVATPSGRGGATWNPEVNELNISITQGAKWREAIQNTTVNVLGMKSDVMYISEVIDVETEANDNTVTKGSGIIVKGNYLKIQGDDPTVGIYLVDEDGTETKIAKGVLTTNEPKKLAFIVPADLEDGTYTLRIVTQYSRNGATLLNTPRSTEYTLYIGVTPPTPEEGGDEEEQPGVPHP